MNVAKSSNRRDGDGDGDGDGDYLPNCCICGSAISSAIDLVLHVSLQHQDIVPRNHKSRDNDHAVSMSRSKAIRVNIPMPRFQGDGDGDGDGDGGGGGDGYYKSAVRRGTLLHTSVGNAMGMRMAIGMAWR